MTNVKLVPLAFSTSGDYCVDMQGLLGDLAKKRRAQRYRVTFSAAEEAGLIARETGALRRELSMTLQDALSYRTRVCLEKQALARPSQVHFRDGPLQHRRLHQKIQGRVHRGATSRVEGREYYEHS